MPTRDWSQRAGRVGRAVARFRLAGQPRMRPWQAWTATGGGGRSFGCDEEFPLDESRVEVVVAKTLVMLLHDDCFETWKRFAAGPQQGNGTGGAIEDEDEV